MKDPIVRKVIEAAGGSTALAKHLGIKQPAVYSWTRVPVGRVQAVSAVTGFPPHELRPDIFPNPQHASIQSKE